MLFPQVYKKVRTVHNQRADNAAAISTMLLHTTCWLQLSQAHDGGQQCRELHCMIHAYMDRVSAALCRCLGLGGTV